MKVEGGCVGAQMKVGGGAGASLGQILQSTLCTVLTHMHTTGGVLTCP